MRVWRIVPAPALVLRDGDHEVFEGWLRAGLEDQDRSGRPRELGHRQIVAETLKPPPKKLGVTHWSTRLLAGRLGPATPRPTPRG
jgi:hypothetical protein